MVVFQFLQVLINTSWQVRSVGKSQRARSGEHISHKTVFSGGSLSPIVSGRGRRVANGRVSSGDGAGTEGTVGGTKFCGVGGDVDEEEVESVVELEVGDGKLAGAGCGAESVAGIGIAGKSAASKPVSGCLISPRGTRNWYSSHGLAVKLSK